MPFYKCSYTVKHRGGLHSCMSSTLRTANPEEAIDRIRYLVQTNSNSELVAIDIEEMSAKDLAEYVGKYF